MARKSISLAHHRRKLVVWFILGIIFSVVAMTGLLLVKQNLFKNDENLKVMSPVIIPPYYDKKAFEQPSDVKKNPLVILEKRIKLPIVMFHYVEYVKDIGDLIRRRLDVSPDVFEADLKSLRDQNYQTYFVKDIPDILDGKISISMRSAVLTFDDGYEDFYKDSFPLLKKYNMRATIYVINDFIGRKGFLNDAELKEIAKSGLVEIGAHTLDHLYLKQTPKSVAEEQIVESKKDLEQRYGIEVKTIAYPYGAFSQETIDITKQAGFIAAVSVIPGVYQTKDNLFYLYRIRAGALGGMNAARVLDDMKK